MTATTLPLWVTIPGTVLLVVNSICGCAAGKARPGIAAALQHPRVPDSVTTVFAGADIEATARAREYLLPYPPSSPAIGLFRDGKLVFMMERRDIETRSAPMIPATCVPCSAAGPSTRFTP